MDPKMRIVLTAILFSALTFPNIAQAKIERCLGFIGVWDRAQPMLDAAGKEAGLNTLFVDATHFGKVDESSRKSIAGCPVIFVLNMAPAEALEIAGWLSETAPQYPDRRVVALDTRGVHAEFQKQHLLVEDEIVKKYWRANGAINIRRLLAYTRMKYLGETLKVEPPVVVPDFGFYDPAQEDAFADLATYKKFKESQGRWRADQPTAALLIQQSFWVTHDTKVVDAQVRALETHGINPVVVFGDRQAQVDKLLRETKPDVIIEDRHGAMWDSGDLLKELDVPYLRPISMLAYTIEEWKKDPRGLSFRDVGLFMTVQESWGTLEPIVVGGMVVNIGGFHLHEPILERVDRFAGRLASWMNLRRKPNGAKKLAIIYYNNDLGQDDLMRGSPTGAFLDAPESAVRFLPELKKAGYSIDRLPASSAELIQWIKHSGRNLGPWNQTALEEMADSGDAVLIPLSLYKKWFSEKLTPERQAQMIKTYGPPPGKLMVVQRRGQPFIVLPRINLGYVSLMPQPQRGQSQDSALLHSRDIPPPHNYLAFYWWLQNEYQADAIIHWGTHGSLELLPGKEAGLANDDWTDVCVGQMPIIDLWIMDNLAEATLARRRSYAALVDHMVPTVSDGSPSTQYENLRGDLLKFGSLEPGQLKEKFRERISQEAAAAGLLEHLDIQSPKQLLSETDIEKVAHHLDELLEERTVSGMHTLGLAPKQEEEIPYLVTIMGRKFLEHIAIAEKLPKPKNLKSRQTLRKRAEKILRSMFVEFKPVKMKRTKDLDADFKFAKEMFSRLEHADNEITGLLRSLEGRYITPGPGPDPVRNPSSIPGGRFLFSLNPEEVPTHSAWEVGQQLVDEFLKSHHPKKVALDMNGMDTMRDFGVMESQVLYFMGVRPIWDRNNLAIDVELIPQKELGRARVDVFLAMGGMYKENFPTRVRLLDKAIRLVSALKEKDNNVRLGSERTERLLLKGGMSAEKARLLSTARIFGTKPGNMSGTNILYLIPRSGVWDKDDDVSDVYVDNMSYAYTGDIWGEKIDGLYEKSIQGTESIIRVWASNMTSQLSNHHAYEYLGGLSMAITKLTGHQPDAYIADVRNPDGVRMRNFNEVLASNLETELLSPDWIKKMMEHGYAGGGHAAELVKNTFGWAVTRKNSVGDKDWNQIYDVYTKDKYKLGIASWMEKDNPHALSEIAATMLEASRKGYWKATDDQVNSLAALYAETTVKSGDSGGMMSGGNTSFENYVTSALNKNNAKALAKKFSETVHRAPGPTAKSMH
jgi:cobaltochelatase CobN